MSFCNKLAMGKWQRLCWSSPISNKNNPHQWIHQLGSTQMLHAKDIGRKRRITKWNSCEPLNSAETWIAVTNICEKYYLDYHEVYQYIIKI